MAARADYSRRNYRQNASQRYVYGNVVSNPEYDPRRHHEEPEKRKRTSRQVRQNRRNALHMSSGYVVFLTMAAVLALVICVNYVRLQSRLTESSKHITVMQEELTQLKEENNTRYNAVMDSVNLEEIREKAQTDLGMVYAAAGQVVEYKKPSTDYVKQYENIPEDGVLARSDKK